MTGTGPGIAAICHPKISLMEQDGIRAEMENQYTLINTVSS